MPHHSSVAWPFIEGFALRNEACSRSSCPQIRARKLHIETANVKKHHSILIHVRGVVGPRRGDRRLRSLPGDAFAFRPYPGDKTDPSPGLPHWPMSQIVPQG
jgi:hypothetical protein